MTALYNRDLRIQFQVYLIRFCSSKSQLSDSDSSSSFALRDPQMAPSFKNFRSSNTAFHVVIVKDDCIYW